MPKNTGLSISGDQYQEPDEGRSPLAGEQYERRPVFDGQSDLPTRPRLPNKPVERERLPAGTPTRRSLKDM